MRSLLRTSNMTTYSKVPAAIPIKYFQDEQNIFPVSSDETLQGGHHDLRHSASPRLCDDEADSDAYGADETEDEEVGEEDEPPGAGLHHVQADTEGDDELVAGDS